MCDNSFYRELVEEGKLHLPLFFKKRNLAIDLFSTPYLKSISNKARRRNTHSRLLLT